MLRVERAEIFSFVPPFGAFWGILVANEDTKNLSNKFVRGKKVFWGKTVAPSFVYAIRTHGRFYTIGLEVM